MLSTSQHGDFTRAKGAIVFHHKIETIDLTCDDGHGNRRFLRVESGLTARSTRANNPRLSRTVNRLESDLLTIDQASTVHSAKEVPHDPQI